MSIVYHVAVVGCGQLGGRLAKELCRFFNNLEDRCVRRFLMFDGAVVDADDMNGQEFLPEDIGWRKAAVLSGVYKEAFQHIPISGYGMLTDGKKLCDLLGLMNMYNTSEHIALVYNVSGGGRGASAAIWKFYKMYPNCIVMTPVKDELRVAVRLTGTSLSEPVAAKKKKYTAAEATRICRLCLAKTAMIVTGGKLSDTTLRLSTDGLGVLTGTQVDSGKQKWMPYVKKGEALLCVVVGCGGTGGNFIKEYVHTQMCRHDNLSLLVIDGDRVEEKNLARQPFGKADVLQNKAWCLKQDFLAEFPELEGRIFDFPSYLDTTGDLSTAIELTGHTGRIVLVGAVDNHRARQVLESYYHEISDCVYIDAANEWSNGEVVVSVKRAGRSISPLRSFYYPDVLTDDSPSVSQLSCGVVNQSAPQHYCTNLASAQGILGSIEPIITTGRVRGGIFYFDAFREYARFQEVWCNDFL